MDALKNCHFVMLITVIYVIADSTIIVDATLDRSKRSKASPANIMLVNLSLVKKAREDIKLKP